MIHENIWTLIFTILLIIGIFSIQEWIQNKKKEGKKQHDKTT